MTPEERQKLIEGLRKWHADLLKQRRQINQDLPAIERAIRALRRQDDVPQDLKTLVKKRFLDDQDQQPVAESAAPVTDATPPPPEQAAEQVADAAATKVRKQPSRRKKTKPETYGIHIEALRVLEEACFMGEQSAASSLEHVLEKLHGADWSLRKISTMRNGTPHSVNIGEDIKAADSILKRFLSAAGSRLRRIQAGHNGAIPSPTLKKLYDQLVALERLQRVDEILESWEIPTTK